MSLQKISWKTSFIFCLISYSIAAISFSGIILKHDLTGRLIFGTVWGAIGLGWLIRTYLIKKHRV